MVWSNIENSQIQLVEGEDNDLGNLSTSITESEQPVLPVPEEIAEPIAPEEVTGKRPRKVTRKIRDIIEGVGKGNFQTRHLTASLGQVTTEIESDPLSVAEAKRRPDWDKWLEAMNDKISRLQQRGTYEIINPPVDANILTSKWVYRTKKDEHGRIKGHRARLVVRGFNQVPDVDYFPDETFASVAKLASAQAILSIAAQNNMVIHQMDVKSAYLYGKLDDNKNIYKKAPPGIDIGVKGGQVLKLKLTLYGLKQAGRRWYLRFREIMTQCGLKRSDFDHAVFYRTDPLIIIFIHVDDMTLVTLTLAVLEKLKKKIKELIEVVDSGEIHWLLGIEIRRNLHTRSIHLSQCSYIDAILSRYGFADIKPLSLPFDPNIHLTKDQMPTMVEDIAYMRDKPYREALDALQYLSIAT